MSTTTEQWLAVPGYEGYLVSDDGRVWARDLGRCLIPHASPKGYSLVTLSRQGERRKVRVHRLVLAAFIGPCPPGHVACHGDGNPANNHLSNLRYGTYTDNALDTVRHGRHAHARKTHCPQGHAYTAENTRIETDGSRRCRTCQAAIEQRRGVRSHHRPTFATAS